eukprot:CAMPEP_0172532540 /NCGR_PEP_ID=MMETSP1067-20121228/5557_1 /TAXON_ID=265564 ORGANISM="Thalassiosira punctigera, Strain Tpunct2005C2" /NCGR_SAMPLE_ID=MMETSP1067 /ASSEMBLY_ACC=CAM_ASM_000444 /LENGTH=283 /DNA_ID=CAMNT_0013317071 /DNA_START=71 /DNA_END=919 /DNA_ORIENTATION=+
MSAAERQLSPRTRAALQYLRRLKPLDRYAMESYLATSGKQQVRLKRRNVPIRDEGFEEIVVDRSAGYVVGIQVLTSRGDAGRGIVLVDEDGKPRDDGATVTVPMANVSAASSTSGATRGSAAARGSSSSSSSGSRRNRSGGAPPSEPHLSDINNELLLQYGLMALGALVALKIIFAALNVLSILVLPLLYLYACSNVPSNESFDAKKELKRVMRGAHLPEERQPQGFFEQGLNRLAASVTAELATSLGYEMSVTDYLGAAKLASVKVPVAGAEYYWVGIVGKW